MLYTGVNVDPGNIIPPNVPEFVHVGHCSPECTETKFMEGSQLVMKCAKLSSSIIPFCESWTFVPVRTGQLMRSLNPLELMTLTNRKLSNTCIIIVQNHLDSLQPFPLRHSSSSSEYPIVTGPEDMRGLTLLEALNMKVNWTSRLVDNLQLGKRWAPQRGICHSDVNPGGPNVETTYPNATPYEPMFTCE